MMSIDSLKRISVRLSEMQRQLGRNFDFTVSDDGSDAYPTEIDKTAYGLLNSLTSEEYWTVQKLMAEEQPFDGGSDEA